MEFEFSRCLHLRLESGQRRRGVAQFFFERCMHMLGFIIKWFKAVLAFSLLAGAATSALATSAIRLNCTPMRASSVAK